MPGLDSNTKLLMHMDGSDAGTTFPDSSITSPKGNSSVTADVNTRTAIKKWGSASAEFDGDSGFLSYIDSVDWDIGTTWLLDLQVKHDDHVGTEVYITQYQDATHYWKFEHIHGTGLHFQVDGGGADINISGGEITDTDFHHVVVFKEGSDVGIYLDGTQVVYGSANCTTSFTGNLYIGQNGNSGDYFDGYMDEPRIQHSNYFNASPTAEVASITQTDHSALSIYLGEQGGNDWIGGQTFTLTEPTTILAYECWVGVDEGTPSGNVEFRIETTSAGLPTGTLAHANATKSESITGSPAIVKATFANSFILAPGTYAMVLEIADQAVGTRWGAYGDASDPPYPGGNLVYSLDSGSTWNGTTTEDLYFKVYTLDTITVPTAQYSLDFLGYTQALFIE